ncbi:UNVERIFIED_CONTAM: hypothetical protein Slati_0927100 [Sesamum latifolium]|uniref:Reverse transcriptase domain-containing protein n=1 Tax=Sesamum latifolium TaxID=2727402 RepID=A0AAW2XRX0_9LAMI
MVEILRGMEARVSNDMNEVIIQPFTADEVKLAISQMYPYKFPGPDGMSLVFDQKYWHIVGPKVISFVLDFLNHGQFDVKLNYTYIVLISKCVSPKNMSHFRPISLYNITYKIVSEMLANRLKPILSSIISESQSVFLPDNVLVAYDLNHYLAYKTWDSVGHTTLKLDLSKVYDQVEWIFLERVLIRFNFHPRFISLLISCVPTLSYSLMLDSQKFDYSHPQWGCRHGNPLSLYLFLFCAKALSHLLTRGKRMGSCMVWRLVVRVFGCLICSSQMTSNFFPSYGGGHALCEAGTARI